jgi:hypothetical protein
MPILLVSTKDQEQRHKPQRLIRTRQILRRSFLHGTMLTLNKGGCAMRIELIEQDQASDQVRRIYDSLAQRLGSVSNFYKMLAHKPEILRAFSQLYAALWADSALSIVLKELAHLRVSIVNGCVY